MTELLLSELKTLPHYLARIIHRYRFHKDLSRVWFSIFVTDFHHGIENRHHIWRQHCLEEIASIMETIIVFKKFFVNWNGNAEWKEAAAQQEQMSKFYIRVAMIIYIDTVSGEGVLQTTVWNSKSPCCARHVNYPFGMLDISSIQSWTPFSLGDWYLKKVVHIWTESRKEKLK